MTTATITNRQEWNEVATKATSEIVDGDVEVVLKNKRNGYLTISIYSENKEAHDEAVALYIRAGSDIRNQNYYEADEDMGEAWQTDIGMIAVK